MLRGKMVMLMFSHVRRGDVAERRGVLMEIRGKHNCVLAAVSTKLPPLEGETGRINNGRKTLEIAGEKSLKGWRDGGELLTRLRDVSAGLEVWCEGRPKDMQVSCPTNFF